MGKQKALESGELYTVGWIAALSKEMTAALAMLDERHDKPKDFVKPSSDTNAYRWGRIGDHNVVIASLAAGVYGTTSAATTAIHMLSSFPSIKVGLMVGIGAGIPGPNRDIRLGDVVVSQPHGQTGGVIQYDLGKSRVRTEQGNTVHTFERVGFLKPPPEALLKALSLLQAEVRLDGSSISHFLEDMFERHPSLAQSGSDGPGYIYQGAEHDRLFEASYLHTSDIGCSNCDPTRMISRVARSNPSEPKIHYGLIASGNELVKDAAERDAILMDNGGDCICLEMEAAGLMNSFPCLVIRGICDYADSHKNDDWQEYAAATAAAYAKEFLGFVDNGDLARTSKASEILKQISEDLSKMNTNLETTGTTIQELRLNHQQEKIISWLSAADPSTNYTNALEKRHPESGLWFIHGKAFEKWKRQPKSFLWLHGIPGCGKTVLSSTIIEHLKSNIKPDQPLLYFYFDFNDSNKQTLEKMLLSLAVQLYQGQPETRHVLDHLWETHSNGNQHPSKQSVSAVLLEMFRELNNTSVVLDALDESSTRSALLDWLESIHKAGCSVRILVTARREESIESALQGWMQPENRIGIQGDDVDDDIRAYVGHTVRNSKDLDRWQSRPDVQVEIESELVEKADGMFRWVACQLDALKDCLDYPRLRQALENLPETLYGTYTRILEKIPKEWMDQATTILNLLIWSDRLFEINELVDAVAVDLDHEPGFDPKNRMPAPRESVGYVRVRIRAGIQCVQDSTLPTTTGRHWMDHARGKETKDERLWKLMIILFLERPEVLSLTQLANEGLDTRRTVSPISYASYGGLTQMVEYLLDQSAESTGASATATHDYLEEALRLASRRAHDTMVQMLLDRGADVNAGDGCALRDASRFGHDTIVQLLLDKGADVNAKDGLALREASRFGQEATVRLLLDRGADVNANNGFALREASVCGHDSIVQLLLDRGANVNANNGLALREVSVCGYDSIAQLLLDRGADVDARDEYGETALIKASKNLHYKILQLLLDRGADVNARDQFGETAVIKASNNPHYKTLQLLLDRGADVNAEDEFGETPLRKAIKNCHYKVLRLLLDGKASLDLKKFRASLRKRTRRARKLISIMLPYATAEFVTQEDEQGKNILHHAAIYGWEAVVQKCLDLGVEIHSRDSAGNTALHYAAHHAYWEILKMFLGARPNDKTTDEFDDVYCKYMAMLPSQERQAGDPNRGRKRRHESIESSSPESRTKSSFIMPAVTTSPKERSDSDSDSDETGSPRFEGHRKRDIIWKRDAGDSPVFELSSDDKDRWFKDHNEGSKRKNNWALYEVSDWAAELRTWTGIEEVNGADAEEINGAGTEKTNGAGTEEVNGAGIEESHGAGVEESSLESVWENRWFS
ncbi:purine and uridine phosphorylase, partial [Aureobasidium melanogenum]